MAKKEKISLPTKFLSNRHYLNEVSVEGKKAPKFNFTIGYYDLYAMQIIRLGNCITLLSSKFTLTEETFWNANHFEDLAKYIFWTFNQGFLHKLRERVKSQSLPILDFCHKMLRGSPVPYGEPIPGTADEELKWCYVKNNSLKGEPKFNRIYSLDQENRKAFLMAVEKRIADLVGPLPHLENESRAESSPEDSAGDPGVTVPPPTLLQVLRPMNGSPEETLQFIINQTEQAGLPFKLFSPVRKLGNGKNRYGLNGCIGAIIETFYQLNYFKREYSQEEIFQAYFRFSGNSIAKLKTFLAEFRDDRHFRDSFSKLKALKISKLS